MKKPKIVIDFIWPTSERNSASWAAINKFALAILLLIFVLAPIRQSGSRTKSMQVLQAPQAVHSLDYQASDIGLREQITKLFTALNKRDLEAIKSQISPNRIFVEISDKAGAYLSNSQTLAVMEAFLRSHTSVSAKFEFDSKEGPNGSASGALTARKDGRTFTYRLNFGFVLNDKGNWLLTRISMR
ncbi:MAG: hypothetical protein ABI444_09460 [Candidatus Kapaibacterium sp.]